MVKIQETLFTIKVLTAKRNLMHDEKRTSWDPQRARRRLEREKRVFTVNNYASAHRASPAPPPPSTRVLLVCGNRPQEQGVTKTVSAKMKMLGSTHTHTH